MASIKYSEQLADVEAAKNLGLLPEEYDRIKDILGRTPNFTEVAIFSVMWSEHCSYKNSITWLKTLPKDGPHMLAKAGEENAGLVDIGDGLACCFKIESHNHPSAIEPFQGAATGVGGIQRDIFTMGARPIASLNSLRFGDLASRHMRRLVKGVVEGIGHYGNCFGVPTVGGEVYFNDCYNHDILVNAVTPAAAKTAIFDQMTQTHIDFMLSKIPKARFVLVEELAAMVAWLASEDCAFSTGAVFDISGGRATY